MRACRGSSVTKKNAGAGSVPIGQRVEIVAEKPTEAILFLSEYGVRCTISTGNMRLLDLLNDANSQYLRVTNARFFQRGDFQSAIDIQETVVVKTGIQLVVIDEADESDGKLFFATLERKTRQAMVSLPTAIVKGTLHVKMARDPQAFLSVEAAGFVPLTNARIYQLTSSAKTLESRVALIRREEITSLSFEIE
jgi:hypothetical protein